jgi:hypothetical protein
LIAPEKGAPIDQSKKARLVDGSETFSFCKPDVIKSEVKLSSRLAYGSGLDAKSTWKIQFQNVGFK